MLFKPFASAALTSLLLLAPLLAFVPVAQAAEQAAFSVPVSAKVLEATLVLPDGQEGRLQVRDGGMITVRDNVTGEAYHFVPAVSESDAQRVEVMVLRGFKTESGDEGVEQIGDPQVLSLGGDSMALAAAFGLRLDGISEQRIDDSLIGQRHEALQHLAAGADGKPPAQESICCVSCGAYTVCSCVVNLNCGSCCTGDCCNDVRNEPKHDSYP